MGLLALDVFSLCLAISVCQADQVPPILLADDSGDDCGYSRSKPRHREHSLDCRNGPGKLS